MPIYTITQNDILDSKELTKRFDKQKIYDKIFCENNYIGVLGERKFKDYLSNLHLIYTWNTFIKPDYSQPDFLIAGKSVDIKTTYDTRLWIQKPEWDYYVLTVVEPDNSSLSICGWIDKKSLKKFCNKKYLIERNGRKDYAIPIEKLKPMKEFEQEIRKNI